MQTSVSMEEEMISALRANSFYLYNSRQQRGREQLEVMVVEDTEPN